MALHKTNGVLQISVYSSTRCIDCQAIMGGTGIRLSPVMVTPLHINI